MIAIVYFNNFKTYPLNSHLKTSENKLCINHGIPIINIVNTVDNNTPYNPIKLTNITLSIKFEIATINGLNLSACHIPAESLYKFKSELISYI